MLLIQILLLTFFLYAVYRVIGRFRAGDITKSTAAFWILLWGAGIAVALFPAPITFYFARLVGVGRGADLVVYSGLALLFFMVFKLIVKVERMNKDMTRLVRKIALDAASNENMKILKHENFKANEANRVL